jgi:ribosomal protein S18 acetylase RimI-like enzyme
VSVVIRAGRSDDAPAIRQLYLTVSEISGGLARLPNEITVEYIDEFVKSSLATGLMFIAEEGGRVLGEIHAYPYGQWRLKHVLSYLTIAVHPDAQGKGVGRKLFDALLAEVRANRPDITRIELITQESNAHAQRLYESVGFRREGKLEQGIRNQRTGELENDIPMGWVRSRDG